MNNFIEFEKEFINLDRVERISIVEGLLTYEIKFNVAEYSFTLGSYNSYKEAREKVVYLLEKKASK